LDFVQHSSGATIIALSTIAQDFYLAGIQDVTTSKDIGVAMQLWPACVNEARKENEAGKENKGLLGWHVVVGLDVK
jgi:hypothetical protein